MAKGYWIAQIEVTDPEKYEGYKALSGPAAEAYGGRFLVRGGRCEGVEGATRTRNVIVEYPSYETALEAYRSPEYAKARAARADAADFNFTIVEGVD
jgi:uncharacterized protein (DUF1330 family)